MRTLPHDPVFPSLAEYFAAGAVPSFVADAISSMVPGLRDARSAELRFLRYRPAKRCVFLWAFHRTTGPAALVSGTVLRAGEGRDRHQFELHGEREPDPAEMSEGPERRGDEAPLSASED